MVNTPPTYQEILEKAKQLGINMKDLSRLSGVNRNKLARWKRCEPTVFKDKAAIDAVIQDLERAQAAQRAAMVKAREAAEQTTENTADGDQT